MKLLLVIDMQKDFTTGVLGNEQTAAAAPACAAKIREFRAAEPDGAVIATFDTHTPDYLNTQEGRNLPVVHCVKGTDGWMLDDTVAEALGEHFTPLEKVTFGAIDLPDMVKKIITGNTLDEVQLIGVCTDICVISNAMLIKAAFPEVPVTVFADCCAGVTPQSHNNALEAMKMCQINVKTGDAE